MAKKIVKQAILGIESVKSELMAQITGLTEVDTDQAGICLTREISRKNNAVNVCIHQPDKDGKVMIEIQLLAKPIVNTTKKIETIITGKHSNVILAIKRAIRSCRILHGIRMEIDSIIEDFEESGKE